MGTESGSPNLPSIVGTPILNGRLPGATTDGVAVLIDQQGYFINFGELFPEFPEFEGLILPMPDLSFVAPGTLLTAEADTTDPVRVPVDFIGIDNHLDPGNTLTESFNPVVGGVDLKNTVGGAPLTVNDQAFLFDTGAQLTIISTAIAEGLGLDLANPEFTIDVGGAGGTVSVGGFTISELMLPRDDDNDGVVEDTLVFTQAPVFVLDLGHFDGIIGMNLFNTAAKMIYDPHDPDGAGPAEASLRFTFSTLPREDYEPDGAAVDALKSDPLLAPLAASFRGQALPSFNLNFAPTVAADQAAVTAFEGQTATNTGTFADSDLDIVELSASLGTITKSGVSSGTWNWSLTATDGPAGPTTVTITATDGQAVQTTTFTVTIDNVKPTIALAGDSQVNKLATYTLQLGNVVDPGSDTITGYQIHWGDGTTTGQISGSPNGATAQHQYAVAGNLTITVDLFDEDGAPHTAAGSQSILVADAASNLKVIQRGKPAQVTRGAAASLTLTIFNLGNSVAAGVFVTQRLPARMAFVRAGSTSGWQLVGPRTYRLFVGSLQPGQSVKLTFKARVASSAALGSKLATIALAGDDGSNGPDANLADNRFRLVTMAR